MSLINQKKTFTMDRSVGMPSYVGGQGYLQTDLLTQLLQFTIHFT